MKKYFMIGLAVIFALTVGLIVYGAYLNQQGEPKILQRMEARALPVHGAKVARREMHTQISLDTMNLHATQMSDAVALIDGRITEAYVERGSAVQEGQPLFAVVNEKLPIFSPKDCPSLFAETKSNLTEREVKSLAEIGFTMMQPGIESLSDHVLELMDKGNTAIRHLALLKYACRYRVYMTWNWLHAFPGETAKDYEEGIRLVPFITHLQPPVGFMSLVYHRNSVYTEHPEDYGLDLVPDQWYDFMSPDDDGYIADIAYVYKDRAHPYEAAPLLPLYRELDRLVREWQVLADGEAFGDRLEMREGPESTEIIDFRKYRTATRHVLTGLAQRVYALCRAPVSLAKLAETLKAPEKEVMDVLADLEGRRLLIGIGGEYLALAVEVL